MRAMGEKTIGSVNWLGLRTLCGKEVKRFLKVYMQTVLAPTVTTLLYLAVFALALSGSGRKVGTLPFIDFLAPGLIAMGVLQNAFANSSSSLIIAKVQGNIVDTLMPPLSALELTLGFTIGGIVRGLCVGAAVWIPCLLIPGIHAVPQNPALIFLFAILGAGFMSTAGALTSIWAEKFDHTALITNFIVAPLTLLSGTFFSVTALGPKAVALAHFNPFFYVIDGVRAGFTGVHDGNLALGVLILIFVNIALGIWCWKWFDAGYKIRS